MTKRKQRTSPIKPNPSKKRKKTKKNPKPQSHDFPVEIKPCDQTESVTGIVSEERTWENLQLLLSLQSNDLGDKE